MRLIDINQCTNDDLVEWDNDLECWKFSVDIYEIPTVDAVEVVRCKDCKHWDKPNQPNILCGHMRANDYCVYGERRDGD